MSSVSIHALWQTNSLMCKQESLNPLPALSFYQTAPRTRGKFHPPQNIHRSLFGLIPFHWQSQVASHYFPLIPRCVHSIPCLQPLGGVSGSKILCDGPFRYYGLVSELSLAAAKPNLSFQSSVMLFLLPEIIHLHLCLPHSTRSGLETQSPESLLCGLASSVGGPSLSTWPAYTTQKKHQLYITTAVSSSSTTSSLEAGTEPCSSHYQCLAWVMLKYFFKKE